MSRDDLMIAVESYASLLRHPGYHLLEIELGKLEANELQEMRNAKDSDALLKHTHAYLTIQQIAKLPKLMLETLAQKLPKQHRPL